MTSLLWLVMYLAVLAPLLTPVHELAHVAVALALVPQDVIVRIGARPTVQLLKWGRLQVLVQLWGGWVGGWGWTADKVEANRRTLFRPARESRMFWRMRRGWER